MARRFLALTALGVLLAAALVGGCRRSGPTATGQAATAKPFVASVEREAYHRSTCRWAAGIATDNLIGYDTREGAEADGRRPCKVCRP